MTNEELSEIRAYVAERQAARARGEHIDSDERREAALLDALDEAHEEAAQWKRLAEQTTDARLAEAIASREVMLRERDEATRERDAAEARLDAIGDDEPKRAAWTAEWQRAQLAERDLAEARSQLAALHAAASGISLVMVDGLPCIRGGGALDATLADVATAAREHDALVRAPVEAERDALAMALAEVRDAAIAVRDMPEPSERLLASVVSVPGWGAMTARETLTPDGVEVVIGEARAHVEHDAWLSRGTRRTLGVLLAEIDRLRARAAEEEGRKLALGVEMNRAWADAYATLRNERDRLRALPVLRTCGECPAHAEVGDDGPNGADGIGYVCGHHEDLRATGPGDTPPSWCPLRGER